MLSSASLPVLPPERHPPTADPVLPVADLPSLLSLAAALEAKDEYTSHHGDRVAAWAFQLGAALGLGPAKTEHLRMSAIVHDVGKINVPDSILNKPGKLSPCEWRKMARHPIIGAQIVSAALPALIPGVLHHHERFDGLGYPSGLVGEGIPIEGRIIAVIDSFDAMTSDRPYRRGMSVDQAVAILCQGCGVQWDTAIVEAFLGLL